MKKIIKTWKLMMCMLIVFVGYECCHNSIYLENTDATHLERQSFVLVFARADFTKLTCDEKTGTCHPEMLSVAAKGSSVVVNHHDNETYIASVAHICIINPPRVFTNGIPPLSVKTDLKLTLYDLYGNSHEATVLYTDVANDICVMKSPGTWGKKVKIADEMPQPGEKVLNIAAPFGIWSPGMVPIFDGYYAGPDGTGNEFFTLPTRPGSSGSPIFNRDGELIGLIHSASMMFENLGLGCKLENLKSALEAHAFVGSRSSRSYDHHNYYCHQCTLP